MMKVLQQALRLRPPAVSRPPMQMNPVVSVLCRAGALAQQPLLRRLLFAGVLFGGLAAGAPGRAEKIPFNNSYFATSWCTAYPTFPLSQGCVNSYPPPNPPRPFLAWLVYVDWGFGPNDPVGKVVKINLDVDYNPAVLEFRRDQTSLLCDLRAAGVTPFCPAASPGQGTMPLGVVAEDFTVDQTGLSIAETVNSAGLPRLNFEYTSPTPITFSGERNFLALAFDLRVPLGANATVT